MNRNLQKLARTEIGIAISADERANANYYHIIRRFISGESDVPEFRLDSAGLKDIDAAWTKLNETSKYLRRAYMKLYDASL